MEISGAFAAFNTVNKTSKQILQLAQADLHLSISFSVLFCYKVLIGKEYILKSKRGNSN